MELICLKSLKPGDELTFFYPSTEWEMVQPFSCQCGNPDCLQVIMGAAHLSTETLEKYRLTDFIKNKLGSARTGEKQATRKRKKVERAVKD